MVQYLIEKAVLPQAEVFSEVQSLVSEGFVATAAGGTASAAADAPAAAGNQFAFSDDNIQPEAKFMLIDFCTDHFASRAEVLAGEIRACQTPKALSAYLVGLAAFVDEHHPAQSAGLRAVIKEIRDTLLVFAPHHLTAPGMPERCRSGLSVVLLRATGATR